MLYLSINKGVLYMSLLNVIKFEGIASRKWMIYRHPDFEFNNKSKLIVGPGQVAIVVHGGVVKTSLLLARIN